MIGGMRNIRENFMLTQTDIIEMAEEDRAYQRVKELVDLVEPYDINHPFTIDDIIRLAKQVEEECYKQTSGVYNR